MPIQKLKTRFHNRQVETRSRKETKKIQFQGIKSLLERVYHQSKFYRQHLHKAKATPDDINTWEDFTNRIPILTKQDIIKDQEGNPPYVDRLPVSEDRIWMVHVTTGTSGMGQEVHALTKEDAQMIEDCLCYH